MRSGVILFATTSLLCTGCTTVNLQGMAGTSPVGNEVASSDTNVVQRAVEKLRAAFASRGFGEKVSQKKMHAAADMLLNGLAARAASSQDDDYATTPKPVSIVLADIELAKQHVDQTTRAAEVYLEVAPSDRKLDDELDSLQSALMASERAVMAFDAALASKDEVSLDDLRRSVDGLRHVTDAFGARVRMSKSGKIAVSSAAS